PLEKTAMTLPETVELAKTEIVVLTQKGKPLAAVKPLSESDWESLAISSDPHFQKIIEEARQSYQENGGIGIEDLRKELDLPVKRGSRSRAKKAQARPRKRKLPA